MTKSNEVRDLTKSSRPEPLKGKIVQQRGEDIILPLKRGVIEFVLKEDIRSAVEWLKRNLTNLTEGGTPLSMTEEEMIHNVIKRAFEDVMKDE